LGSFREGRLGLAEIISLWECERYGAITGVQSSENERRGLTSILNWKAEYDQDDSVIYLLDAADWTIARCNPAWDRFALANHGEAAKSAKVVGMRIMGVVPADVQRFRRDWWHNRQLQERSQSVNAARKVRAPQCACTKKVESSSAGLV
jgi:hypothetical protein